MFLHHICGLPEVWCGIGLVLLALYGMLISRQRILPITRELEAVGCLQVQVLSLVGAVLLATPKVAEPTTLQGFVGSLE